MRVAAIQPLGFSRSDRLLTIGIVCYQLLILVSVLYGFVWIGLLLLAAVLPALLFLPLNFWMYAFMGSLFVFFNPWHHYQLADLMALILVAIFAIWYFSSKRIRLDNSSLSFPIFLFLFVIGLSLLDAADLRTAVIKYARYLLLFFTYWVLHNMFFVSRHFSSYLTWYVLLSLAAGSTMLLQLFFQQKLRAFGIAGIPFNDLLVAANIIAFSFVVFVDRKRRLWLLASTFLLLLLVITQTRGAWLSLLLTITFLVAFLYKKERSRLKKVFRNVFLPATVVGVVSLIFVITTIPRLQYMFVDRVRHLSQVESEGRVSSVVTRVFIWDTAVNVFKQHPINGVGIDLFPTVSERYYTIHPVLYELFVEGLDPHLLVLTFLTETGVIGTIGFLVLLFSALRLALRTSTLTTTNEEKAISLSLIGVMIFVTLSSFYAGSWFYGQNGYQFIFFLALTTAFYRDRVSRDG